MLDVLRPAKMGRRTIIRMVLLAMLIVATVLTWTLVRQWQEQRLQVSLGKLRDDIEQRWAETNLRFLQPARKLCDEVDSGSLRDPAVFDESVQAIRHNFDVYEAIYWISSDATRLAGGSAKNRTLEPLPYGSESALWSSMRVSAGRGQPTVGPSYEGDLGQPLVLLYFPLGERGERGGIAAVVRTSRLIEHFADEQLRQLVSVSIHRDSQVIYHTGDYLVERDPRLRLTSRLPMLDQVWLCQIMPTSQFIRQHQSQTDEVVLTIGVVTCLLTATWLLDAMKRRWQHISLERGHLQVIEIISELSRSISGSRGEWKRSLLAILESAQPLTDSDVIGIYQLSSDRRRLELISAYGHVPLDRTIELASSGFDLLRDVFGGKPLPISRARRDAMTALRLFEHGALNSGVLAPLMSDRLVGVMLFASQGREPWSDGRCSLVKLWASQTASLLGDEAIHEQMRDALAVQEKLSQRREMMLTLLGELYQAGSTEATLSHIAQYAPRALGIEACVVALRTSTENELEIVAATGELGVRFFGRRITLTGRQIVGLSGPEGVSVIAPEEVHDRGFGQLNEPWLAGLAYVPMVHSDGRPIGCILLLSATQGAFTSDQLELARVLSRRTSAAIENAQLNQQTRRDAETRSMLLRELNHRVKNNLAGIVGLLSMGSNMDMPENVRQWLDRVTERIGNIARAHELFSGGITTVSLAQLVDQVIPSLAVVKPPGVEIVKELGDRDILLNTTLAVSLGMVIHELCYNAVLHGLGARGTLTIRAQLTESRNVVLDVIDDGTSGLRESEGEGAVAVVAPPVTSTGLGLRLVKGLVGRELRGRFLMRRRSEGGTIVTVEFPLEREREDGDLRK